VLQDAVGTTTRACASHDPKWDNRLGLGDSFAPTSPLTLNAHFTRPVACLQPNWAGTVRCSRVP
jgi:hypothetical protein